MTHLRRKYEALKAFSFETETKAIIEANKNHLADLQASQLAKGINSKGDRILPEYAPFTIQEKKRKGQEYRWVTFRDTGEMYRLLKAQISGSKFSIKADTFKFDKMIKRSGVNTVGLNVDSRRDFVNEITRPKILDVYKKKVTNV